MDSNAENEPEFLFKDPGSVTGSCPAGYRLKWNGRLGLAVQGKKLSASQMAQLRDLAVDEGGVWIPDELGRLIAEYYRDQG